MSKNRSESDILRLSDAAGVLRGLEDKFVREASRRWITFPDAHWLGTAEGDSTVVAMVEVLVKAREAVRAPKIVCPNARVEHTITLAIKRPTKPVDLLLDTKCDFIYEWMKSHCPAWVGPKTEEVTVNLIDMGEDHTHADQIAVIKRLDLIVPPDNAALWTISASKEHRDLQRTIWMVDSGTVWSGEGGSPCLACLRGNAGHRSARLGRIALRWSRDYRVVALSKSSQT